VIYLIVGCTVGIVLWVCKFALCYAIFPKKFNKWLHNHPLGLLVMDTGFGIMAVKTITLAGATGLTTLVALVAYGACTGIIIVKFIIKRKIKETYNNWGGREYV
jgi:hypothetical protein